MEDTLREKTKIWKQLQLSLNPCFNGRYSQRIKTNKNYEYLSSLNPCFNGIYSQREILLYKSCISKES